jgi:hypothetical protein
MKQLEPKLLNIIVRLQDIPSCKLNRDAAGKVLDFLRRVFRKLSSAMTKAKLTWSWH